MKSTRIKVVRRQLATGEIRTYRYEVKAKPPRPRRPKQPPLRDGTIGALIAAYRRSPEWATFSPRTRQLRDKAFEYFNGREDAPLSEITRRNLTGIRNSIAKRRGPGAANCWIMAVQALLGWAEEADWIVARPRLKRLPGGHLATWTEAQADGLIAAMPEQLRRPALVARHTGLRRSDLIRLTWAMFDGQSLRLTIAKTRRAHVVALPADLRAEMDAWRRTATSTHILTTAFGTPWRNADSLGGTITHWLVKHGVRGIGLHGLRKRFAVDLAHAGASALEVAAAGGWRSLAMVTLYTEQAEQERLGGAAVVKLENARNLRKTKSAS